MINENFIISSIRVFYQLIKLKSQGSLLFSCKIPAIPRLCQTMHISSYLTKLPVLKIIDLSYKTNMEQLI